MVRVVDEDLRSVRSAKPHRVLGDRLEDRLEFESRPADRLDHLVRRGLLLEQRLVLARKSVRLSFGRSFRPRPRRHRSITRATSGGCAEIGRQELRDTTLLSCERAWRRTTRMSHSSRDSQAPPLVRRGLVNAVHLQEAGRLTSAASGQDHGSSCGGALLTWAAPRARSSLLLVALAAAVPCLAAGAGAATRPISMSVHAHTGIRLTDVVWTGKRFLYVENTTNVVWTAGPRLTKFASMPKIVEETRCRLSPGAHGFPTGRRLLPRSRQRHLPHRRGREGERLRTPAGRSRLRRGARIRHVRCFRVPPLGRDGPLRHGDATAGPSTRSRHRAP